MNRAVIVLTLAALVICPLAGGLWAGLPGGFFRFPPLLERAHPMPSFDKPVFAIYAFLALWTALPVIFPSRFRFRRESARPRPAGGATSFPVWGWAGLALIAFSWWGSWTQPTWLGPIVFFLFAPLWLGYVLAVDGVVRMRSGSSRLSANPAAFAALFPVSAVLWWYFEYLNRFVKNWWYQGTDVFTPFTYILFATLCFSTVLPAILVTTDLLLSSPRFRFRYAFGEPMSFRAPKVYSRIAFIAGCIALVALTRWPEQAFPLTWIGPLAVAAGGLSLAGGRTPFHAIRNGDWTDTVALALAALVCGFFWEMWNYHALIKWRYAVPYVQVLHVFEMPLLGFIGYLPFGPACWCLWSLLAGLAGRSVPLPGQSGSSRGP